MTDRDRSRTGGPRGPRSRGAARWTEPQHWNVHEVCWAPRIATEVPLGTEAGLAYESVANFDNPFLLSRSRLIRRLGRASASSMSDACTAAAVALGCDGEPVTS